VVSAGELDARALLGALRDHVLTLRWLRCVAQAYAEAGVPGPLPRFTDDDAVLVAVAGGRYPCIVSTCTVRVSRAPLGGRPW
jgi:hypothetical protein